MFRHVHEEEVLKNEWPEILSAISLLSFLLMVCVLSPPRSDESGKQVIASTRPGPCIWKDQEVKCH